MKPDSKPSRHSFDDLMQEAREKKPFPEPVSVKKGQPRRLWPPEDNEPR